MEKNSIIESTSHHRSQKKLSKTQIDISAGICAGMVSTFISHPLDTVKVRIQLSLGSLTIRQCMKDLFAIGGVRLQNN